MINKLVIKLPHSTVKNQKNTKNNISSPFTPAEKSRTYQRSRNLNKPFLIQGSNNIISTSGNNTQGNSFNLNKDLQNMPIIPVPSKRSWKYSIESMSVDSITRELTHKYNLSNQNLDIEIQKQLFGDKNFDWDLMEAEKKRRTNKLNIVKFPSVIFSEEKEKKKEEEKEDCEVYGLLCYFYICCIII
jgi:hypothetical protein